MVDGWPESLIANTLTDFLALDERARQKYEIRRALDIFKRQNGPHDSFPDGAWWDSADRYLNKLAEKAFSRLLRVPPNAWPASWPRPIAAAVARYEPVLRKISHYYLPSCNNWNRELMKHGQIRTHFRHLQEKAIDEGEFQRIPKRTPPAKGAGLIPLLEYMALYPREAEGAWGSNREHIAVVREALIVSDLATCPYVSDEGRQWYKKDRGCILIPFVAHDHRLVGHGMVLLNRRIPLTGEREDLAAIVQGWRALFNGTFAPVISNLNCAALSALDGFFLGRVRELRRVIHSTPDMKDEGSYIPSQDVLILNKMSLYELLESKIHKERFRVVFFDLDGFKHVNGQIGHQLADLLLFCIATRLAGYGGVFSPLGERWLARFGGDEFVGVVPADASVCELSAMIADAITQGRDDYNRMRKGKGGIYNKPLTTSMGWVVTEDTLADNLQDSAIPSRRKSFLAKMSRAELLIEMADTDTQEFVKKLGKNGYLEFKRRLTLRSADGELLKDLHKWMENIRWLPATTTRRRRLNVELWHEPDDHSATRA